jgi:anaphase-promoting complex subunit 3
VYLGLAQYDQQKAELALQNLDRAKELDNEHALVQFNRAMILAALDRNEDALEELQVLAIRAPKESSVYYLMGKIYRKLGQGDKALMLFSWSSDLDPKGNNNSIRDAINKHLPVEDDDDLDPLPLPLPDI